MIPMKTIGWIVLPSGKENYALIQNPHTGQMKWYSGSFALRAPGFKILDAAIDYAVQAGWIRSNVDFIERTTPHTY